MSSILKAPWQVGLAVAATFLVAATYIQDALIHMFMLSGSESLLQVREAALALRWPKYDSVLKFAEFQSVAIEAYFLAGIAVLLMGIFLWVGAFRGGVRGILTVTLIMTFVGSLFPLILSFDAAAGVETAGVIVSLIITVVALVLSLLLWGKAGKKWVRMGAKKKWDQE